MIWNEIIYSRLKRTIERVVNLGKTKFVIYPFGTNGKMAKYILNEEYGIQELFVVDNLLCEGDDNIKSVDYLREYWHKDNFDLLLVIDHKPPKTNVIYKQIADFVTLERMIDALSISMYFNPDIYFTESKVTTDIRHKAIECCAREIYRNNIKGSIAEAGVYKGGTAAIMNRLFPDRKLYLFDTFKGFDERDVLKEDEANRYNEKLDFSDATIDVVMSKMIYPNNCIIKEGWFPESAAGIEDTFSFVRLDMDLYEPIYAGLEYFYPRMEKGGFIAVHDCRSMRFEGAREAVMDFCKMNHINYTCMPDELGTAIISIGF